MKLCECVSFILIDNGKVLLEKRKDDREIDPGLIMIPGGHIEDSETEQQALERELLEELGVKATRTDYVCTLIHTTREMGLAHHRYEIDFLFSLCRLSYFIFIQTFSSNNINISF